MAVEQVLNEMNLPATHVELGEAELEHKPSSDERQQLADSLQKLGFELLESENSVLISQIKTLIIEHIHYNQEQLKVNLSTYLSEKLQHHYTYLSRLFSSVEGITIEKYITAQRIEKVKELLCYEELSLSEIAFKLNYSSVAHLSAQFKKETGMTPTAFKKQQKPLRKSIDRV